MKKQQAFEIIIELVKVNDKISEFSLIEFPHFKSLQNRITFKDLEKDLIESALKFKVEFDVPFWDSLFLTMIRSKSKSNLLLGEALFHNYNYKKHTFENKAINKFLNFFDDKKYDNIAINSTIKTKQGEKKHIPLLDFNLSVNPQNQIIVEKVLNKLGFSNGYLLRSGKSYHFFGIELIDDNQLINLLGRALLYTPIIDGRWIGHQLIERSCSLRISNKYDTFPHLIKIL